MSHPARRRLPSTLAPLGSGALIAWVLFGGMIGCDLLSPEFEVRNLIDRAQAACQRRDADAFHALLAEGYQDDSGRSREEALHAVANYLLVHRQVHCVTRVAAIKMQGKTARAEVYAAFADRPIKPGDDLNRIGAELLHLDLDIAADEQGRLVVTRAHRRPVSAQTMRAQDFLP
jgi:hypothetical protein